MFIRVRRVRSGKVCDSVGTGWLAFINFRKFSAGSHVGDILVT
jgi:hypothetical protein